MDRFVYPLFKMRILFKNQQLQYFLFSPAKVVRLSGYCNVLPRII